jgi:predicted N-formylglutamate amidohydrolase
MIRNSYLFVSLGNLTIDAPKSHLNRNGPDQRMNATPLLGFGDPAPVIVQAGSLASPFLLTCDHAGRAIPEKLGNLGLSAQAREAHIAWDLHALALAREIAKALDATLVAQAYSRLVIDCNRQPAAVDSIAEVSDGVPVPGNAGLTREARRQRIEEILEPYQGRIATERGARAGRPFCLVCVHSFTPQLQRNGAPRPWTVGVISDADARLRRALLTALAAADPTLVLGDNEPYAVSMANDYTVPLQAEAPGIPYVELEFRNDTIADPAARSAIAALMAAALRDAWARIAGETEGDRRQA